MTPGMRMRSFAGVGGVGGLGGEWGVEGDGLGRVNIEGPVNCQRQQQHSIRK